MRNECDTLIVIPNDRLLQLGDRNVSVMDAFRTADQVLLSGVQGITDLITTPGLINLDFADVKSVMSGAGSALAGAFTPGLPRRTPAVAAPAPTATGERLVGHTGHAAAAPMAQPAPAPAPVAPPVQPIARPATASGAPLTVPPLPPIPGPVAGS